MTSKFSWILDYKDWEGTASDLARVVTEVRGRIGIFDDDVTPNERLIRHYVQQGVLQRPERRGKEAIFGFRQITEFLTARILLRDGWPLAKVAELNRAMGLEALIDVLPEERDEEREMNQAQKLVSRFQQDSAAPPDSMRKLASPNVFLRQSAELTKNRISRRDALEALENLSASPERDSLVRLVLAPWCHVYLDPEVLRRLPPETPELLGQVLTQCLMDERMRTGDKK